MKLRLYTNFSEMSVEGSFYLLLVPMLTFIFITTDILKEKEKSLRKGMMTMGLRSSAYWACWFITSLFFAFLSSAVTILAGNLLKMKYFTDTSFGINFLILFVFSMSMQFLGYALCTAIETVKTGNSITYGLFLLGMVIQAILGN